MDLNSYWALNIIVTDELNKTQTGDMNVEGLSVNEPSM